MHVGGRCPHQINKEKRLMPRAVCRIKHMHDEKKRLVMIMNQCALARGVALYLPRLFWLAFFFLEAIKDENLSQRGNRSTTKAAALQRKRDRSRH